MNKLLTPKDVADILQVSEHTIRRYVALRAIPYVKFTRGRMSAVRFREESIEKWLVSREVNHTRKEQGNVAITDIMSRFPSKDSSCEDLGFCEDEESHITQAMGVERRIRNIREANLTEFTRRYIKLPKAA